MDSNFGIWNWPHRKKRDLVVIVINNDSTFFQVLLSAFIGPSLVYYTLVYWVYPMKDYVGETGCHITFFLRNAGVFAFQLQSLSMALFRYICLFHSGSVRKLHISLNVSCKDQIMKPLCLCLQVLNQISLHLQLNINLSRFL